MKHVLCFFAVVLTVFALSLNAVAQPGGGRGPGGGGMGGMIPGGLGPIIQAVQNPEFLKMLEITPEQQAAIIQVGMEAWQRARDTAPPPQQGEMPNFDQRRQQMNQMIDSLQAEVDKILRPEQRVKLRQMTFQMAGGMNALNIPFVGSRVLEALDLTPAQKEQVTSIMEKRDAEIQALSRGINFREASPEEREKFQADRESISKKYNDQITALLNPEQKEKADNLTKEAPALREKLGLPEPGPGPQRGQRGQGGPVGPAGGYTPGEGSWRPGQTPPTSAPPAGEQRRRGGFPREE